MRGPRSILILCLFHVASYSTSVYAETSISGGHPSGPSGFLDKDGYLNMKGTRWNRIWDRSFHSSKQEMTTTTTTTTTPPVECPKSGGPKCPANWIQTDSDSCILIDPSKVDKETASRTCKGYGGDLLNYDAFDAVTRKCIKEHLKTPNFETHVFIWGTFNCQGSFYESVPLAGAFFMNGLWPRPMTSPFCLLPSFKYSFVCRIQTGDYDEVPNKQIPTDGKNGDKPLSQHNVHSLIQPKDVHAINDDDDRNLYLPPVRPKFESFRPKFKSSRPKFESSRPKVESSRPKFKSSRPKVESSTSKFERSRPKFESSEVHEGKRYYLSTGGVTIGSYEDAVLQCKHGVAEGGRLAEIDSQGELDFIKNFLKKAKKSGYRFVFVSGTDALQEGNWVHQSTGQRLSFIEWGQGQPDNARGREDCLVLHRGSSWKMNDYRCSRWNKRVSFLCEATPDV